MTQLGEAADESHSGSSSVCSMSKHCHAFMKVAGDHCKREVPSSHDVSKDEEDSLSTKKNVELQSQVNELKSKLAKRATLKSSTKNKRKAKGKAKEKGEHKTREEVNNVETEEKVETRNTGLVALAIKCDNCNDFVKPLRLRKFKVGNTFSFNNTVKEVKNEILQTTKIPVSQQVLKLGADVLEDGTKVGNIPRERTLILHRKLNWYGTSLCGGILSFLRHVASRCLTDNFIPLTVSQKEKERIERDLKCPGSVGIVRMSVLTQSAKYMIVNGAQSCPYFT